MEDLKKILLQILEEYDDYLSWYQLNRKLRNRDLHQYLSNLTECLNILVEEGLVITRTGDKSGMEFYRCNRKENNNEQ